MCALSAATACTDSMVRPPTPAPITLDAARSHADSERVGYFRARAESRGLAPGAASRTLSSASATVVSVTPGWVQGNLQRQPIVATLSGNVNSVKVSSGQLPGDAILCSGNYGTLIAYDANGATLGSAPLALIDPADCGSDNVTFGAQATVTVTQGVIASFKILPMSPFEFPVNGVKGGRATATYSATLTEYPSTDAPPVASWFAGCDNNALTCTLDASGSTDDVGIVSYDWDLNKSPGGTASGVKVTVTYPAAGPRTITLTVTDTKGQKSSMTMTVQVGALPGQPPSAYFSMSCAGPQACTFDSSPSSGSTALVRSWNFGDGTTAGDIVAPVHAFPSGPGIYPVLLTVTDGYGLSNSMALAVSVGQPIGGSTAMSIGGTCAGATCTYSAGVNGTNPPFVLAWNFGDGTTAGNNPSPTHTYAASGTYAILVTVTDALGGVSAGAFPLTVTVPASPPDQAPTANFNWTCAGLNPHQCAFDPSGSTDDKGIVSYKWDWGNGRAETKTALITTRNTWASSGTYQVTLTVTDTKGQTNAVTKSVVVP
jgi:PKD repeat protein